MSELNFLSEHPTQSDNGSDNIFKSSDLTRKHFSKIFKVERVNKRFKRTNSFHRKDEHHHSWHSYKDLSFLNFEDSRSNKLKCQKIFELEADDQLSDDTVDKSRFSAILNDGFSANDSNLYFDNHRSR